MTGVETYMQAMMKMREMNKDKLPKPNGWKYSCMEDFVLANGRLFTYKPLPKKIKRGEMKLCYMNAYHLVMAKPELIYVEGFAAGIIPTAHAWCVDRKGRVYDPTWQDGQEYFGVPFDPIFVLETIAKREHYGVIDDWENKWPLIQGVRTDFLHSEFANASV
jgi:hypothetical protein